jgi:hypothetical protein
MRSRSWMVGATTSLSCASAFSWKERVGSCTGVMRSVSRSHWPDANRRSVGSPEGFARTSAGNRSHMAVIIFIALVVLVVLVWAAIAFFRGAKEAVEGDAGIAAGHQFPAERQAAPTLVEEDLSFANRDASDLSRTEASDLSRTEEDVRARTPH